MSPAGAGIQIYCAPTADDSELWLASMRHIAHEGGCFVMSAKAFHSVAGAQLCWICPRIEHIKLHEHMRRLLLSLSVRIARSKLFLYCSLFFRCYNTFSLDVYIYTHGQITDQPTIT
jgi:hypothetical protein